MLRSRQHNHLLKRAVFILRGISTRNANDSKKAILNIAEIDRAIEVVIAQIDSTQA